MDRGGYIHVAERETMQMREGEIVVVVGGRKKCPHYVHGIHTKLCRTHETQIKGVARGRTRHLEMGAGWDTEGNKEKPVHRQEASGSLREGGGRG